VVQIGFGEELVGFVVVFGVEWRGVVGELRIVDCDGFILGECLVIVRILCW